MIQAPEVIVDEDSHAYICNGVIAPRSVTGLLKKYGLSMDFTKIPARTLDMACQRGKAIAVGSKLIAMGHELGPVDPRIEGYLAGFAAFWKESGAQLIETEVPRISPLGFGFTTDLVIWVGGHRVIADGKATFKLPKSVGPQTAGYLIGYNSVFPETPVEERFALWLKKDGGYKFKQLIDPDDVTSFMDCLDADIKLTKWQTKYGE
jgi:hypothetical protein